MKAQHIFLFLVVSLLALSFLHSPGTDDVEFWMKWIANLESHGVVSGYRANCQMYPPLSPVILFIAAQVSRLFRIDVFTGFKLSLVMFLLLTSALFLAWTKDLFLTAMVQLTLILNSTALAYLDIYFAPTLLLSLWALKARRLSWFTILFSVTCLMKWQPIIIAPVILLYILNVKGIGDWRKIEFKNLMRSTFLPLLAVSALVLLVFGREPIWAFRRALDGDPYLSGNALNFSWVLTHLLRMSYPHVFGGLVDGQAKLIVTEDLRIRGLPTVLFCALYIMVLIAFLRRNKTFRNFILYSLTAYLAYFIFNAGVHENYLFIPSIVAAVLCWMDRNHLATFAFWSVASNVNLFIFYGGGDGNAPPFSRVAGVDIALLLSILNVLFFTISFVTVIRENTETVLEISVSPTE